MQIIIPTTITNNKELLEAQLIRTQLKAQLKVITDQKEKVSRPLLDAIAARRAEFAPTIAKYESEIEKVNKLLITYQNSILALQREKERKILNDARLKPETMINKLSKIEEVNTSGFRKQQVLEITDSALIDKKYWIIDEKLLFDDLKAGKQVKGAQIGVKMIPISTL